MFHDKTVIKFESLKKAMRFGVDFVHNYLIPKYGKEKASKFPLARSGPPGNGSEVLVESLGVKKLDLNQKTWYVIPTDRFDEVQNYINTKINKK